VEDDEFITCICNHCSIRIEFPEYGVGQEVECPSCHQTTILYKPAIPPIIPIVRPAKRSTVAWWIGGAALLVCMLALALWPAPQAQVAPGSISPADSASSTASADADGGDTSRIFPPQEGYDPMEDDPPPEAMPELGLSKQDVINFRQWLGAGSPRYWRGQNMFPALNDEQWLAYRRKVRRDADKSAFETHPIPANR
jgi:hypothetical protein